MPPSLEHRKSFITLILSNPDVERNWPICADWAEESGYHASSVARLREPYWNPKSGTILQEIFRRMFFLLTHDECVLVYDSVFDFPWDLKAREERAKRGDDGIKTKLKEAHWILEYIKTLPKELSQEVSPFRK